MMEMKGRDVRDTDGAVMTCNVDDCSYNENQECWAPDIKVGADHPTCDTYTSQNVSAADQESMVSQCMVSACDFNDQMRCQARGVTVSTHSGHADCLTFRPYS